MVHVMVPQMQAEIARSLLQDMLRGEYETDEVFDQQEDESGCENELGDQ